MGVCNCSRFCCALFYVHYSFSITLIGKREMVDLLSLSSWCLLSVMWLFLGAQWVCLQFVIVVFPDHTHLLFCIAALTCCARHINRRGVVSLSKTFCAL